MDRQKGLVSVGQERAGVNQKKGRTVPTDTLLPGASLNPSAAPVNTYAQTSRVQRPTDALVDALSSIQPGLNKYLDVSAANKAKAKAAEQKKLEEDQLMQLASYRDQFQSDIDNGLVDRTKLDDDAVAKLYPWMVPVVRARLLQSQGQHEGKRRVDEYFNLVENDDELRHNPEARARLREQIRNELAEMATQGGDMFFHAGMVEQFESGIRSIDRSADQETAKNLKEMEREAFGLSVVEAVKNNKDLNELAKGRAATSPLTQSEANQAVVDTIISMAISDNDLSLLDRIPHQVLNVERLEKVVRTRNALKADAFTQESQGWQISERERTVAIRDGKALVNRMLSRGETLLPSQLLNLPHEVTEYLHKATNFEWVDNRESIRNKSMIISDLLQYGSSGRSFQPRTPFMTRLLEENNGVLDPDKYIDALFDEPGLTPADREYLVENRNKLMEGLNVAADPIFSNAFNDDIKLRLNGMLNDSLISLRLSSAGIDLESSVTRIFNTRISQGIESRIVDGGTPVFNVYEKKSLAQEGAAEAHAYMDRVKEYLDTYYSAEAMKERKESGGQVPAPPISPSSSSYSSSTRQQSVRSSDNLNNTSQAPIVVPSLDNIEGQLNAGTDPFEVTVEEPSADPFEIVTDANNKIIW